MNAPTLTPIKSGKVRDIYEAEDALLLVASDRISAYDCVLPSLIPGKGKILTQLSKFWFGFFKDLMQNHYITDDIEKYPPALKTLGDSIRDRSMLVKKAQVLPIECVVRGYLSGSAWTEYSNNGSVCGLRLPSGLQESSKLPEPIFTPATKAETGHDTNISFEEMQEHIGKKQSLFLREKSILLFKKAEEFLKNKGILLADTKFEFGQIGNTVILIDEVLTPDSSRFWPAHSYQEGRAQQSYDKQFVRDYLNSIAWNRIPPVPTLPEAVIHKTLQKYQEIYKIIVG
jgi:phosphoribosylaminoimidazole-succinocarboxamide synthase